MKKWVIVGAVLICCLIFALVKFSRPQGQNATNQAENTRIEEQANIVEPNNTSLAENSGPIVPPPPPSPQVESVTKALTEFQSCLKEGKYEQAWELTSGHFRQKVCDGDFEKFKEVCDQIKLATVTIHPESAVVINDQVGILITGPSLESDLYLFFTKEDGQWRLYIGQEARDVSR
jgi:hypothetical protein